MRVLLSVVVSATAVLTGCAVAKKTYGPNGEVAHSINCSGSALTWGACMEKAGEICGASGYNVISNSGEAGVAAGGGVGSFFAGTTMARSMVVACKGS